MPDPHQHPDTSQVTLGVTRHPRKTRCVACRLRKVKCNGGPPPCQSCHRLGLTCTFSSDEPAGETTSNITSQLVSPTPTRTEAGTARRRTIAACNECRAKKVKCSGHRQRCHRCRTRRLRCVYGAGGSGQSDAESPLIIDDRPGLASAPFPGLGDSNGSDTFAFPLDIASQQRFLKRDVVTRHVEAYFVYLYHLPGYDFFHRPSMLEDLHNSRISPILCTALCAAVAMYVSASKEGRQLSVEWAKDVDSYLFANMNDLSISNLQIMLLSMFQHFAYRQFGRVWLMMGMATRFALTIQLNNISSLTGLEGGGSGVASRECVKRLLWSVFVQDKIHSGGVDEFVGFPEQWLHIPLPLSEHHFQHEQDHQTGTLSDSLEVLSRNGLGANGYMVILHNLRHHILKTTKVVIAKRAPAPDAEVERILAPVLKLQEHLDDFYKCLPSHLALSDRGIFSHSTTPEFTTYIMLHIFYFQACSDTFRICLPGMARESASASFLSNAPAGFVAQWRRLAVSFAVKIARTWHRVLEMSGSGALSLPGGFVPLSPAGCGHIHQCTKILLIARRHQIYTDLVDPVSGETVTLDDETVSKLCRSNVAFLSGLASVAPIAAVVQQDVRDMIKAEEDGTPDGVEARERAPVTSQVQRDKILSRYHVLSMGLNNTNRAEAGTSNNGGSESFPSSLYLAGGTSSRSSRYIRDVLRNDETAESTQPHLLAPPPVPVQEPQQQQQEHHHYHGQNPTNNIQHDVPAIPDEFAQSYWDVPTSISLTGALAPDYSVAASRYDMGGELDWLLMNSLLEGRASGMD